MGSLSHEMMSHAVMAAAAAWCFNAGIAVGETAMRRLAVLSAILAVAVAVSPAPAADRNGKTRTPAETVILSDPAQGRTIGKVGGEVLVLQETANGTVGKMGKDKVLLHKDGSGNTMGKVGDRKLFCHTDAASGLTLCK